MTAKTSIKTGIPEFDDLYPQIKSFLIQDTLEVNIEGKRIRGYRSPDTKSIWIRDYSDMLRGIKYFETDLISTIEHFAETQAENGRIFDYFTTFPEETPKERENWTKYIRVPVEADVEYRFVKSAYLAWQATGNVDWIRKLMPKMEKALQYILHHPWRWDKKTGLIKRAYTIDTWDFAYTAGQHDWLQFQIDENTFWGIMHGDNSGYYEAFRIMALLYTYFQEGSLATKWESRADALKQAMNSVCWNGKFYTHFVKITPMEIPGINEADQLSLSNPMDINRGTATHEMALSIIREYQERWKKIKAFAEWFSIDPPFPDGIFGDKKLIQGAYVNGGIMPLVGGELAHAAFEHGLEEYGVDILRRYAKMIAEKKETYLWYFPDGKPSSIETSTSPEATPTDGWGSSSMLYAFIEGLVGIKDKHKLFEKVKISPRWLAAGIDRAEVYVGYEVSGAGIGYSFRNNSGRIEIDVRAENSAVDFHVLLPSEASASKVRVNGKLINFKNQKICSSHYVDFISKLKGISQIIIEF